MNEVLNKKIEELENAGKYECWYLVKQDTNFCNLCYLVSILKKYQNNNTKENLEEFISKETDIIKSNKPNLELSGVHRALRAAVFLGLIKMNGVRYEDATITETYDEINNICKGEFEFVEKYKNIIIRQIEKMYISSEVDEESNGVRKDYKLFPIMLLYKVLLEIGRLTGNYSISMNEYRYFVATTKKYTDYGSTLFLISLLREDLTANNTLESFRSKFDNRMIQVLKQLNTISVSDNEIRLNTDYLVNVSMKVLVFELNQDLFCADKYINFLCSTKTLLSLTEPKLKDELFNVFIGKSDIGFDIGRNRILFGAPGTGKSFALEEERKKYGFIDKYYERVTFHPDYTYANFVGTYKPVMVENDINLKLSENDRKIIDILKTPNLSAQDKYNRIEKMEVIDTKGELNYLVSLCTEEGDDFQQKKEDGTYQLRTTETNVCRKIKKYFRLIDELNNNSIISYEYVPGPFMRLFVKAKKNPNVPYLLLIEEINRANVAAVFGDLFQLLDRDNNEESMYPVEASEDIKKFLLKEGIKLESNKIKIPSNLFIWATMNSADQGVFPMDTAFKRRWDFEYIGIDDEEEDIKGKKVELKLNNNEIQVFEWNKLRKLINEHIASKKVNEDKQLGPFFISRKIVVPRDGNKIDEKLFKETFKNKVIMYLFEDVFKSRPGVIFDDYYEGKYRLSEICKKFDEIGIKIFNIIKIEDIIEKPESTTNV